MKKFMLCLIAFVAMFVLASCGEPVVVDLEISGYKTEFVQGDTFDDGDLLVNATYSDESVVDVTSQATVSQSADMNTPGSYAVIVSFGGLSEAYQITVSARVNSSTLTAISVDATDAKVVYELGEEVSLENVVVYESYDNTEKDDAIVAVNDLAGYTVKVTDQNGTEVNGALNAFGTYTVTVSKGQLSDSYKVNVGATVYASVSDALAAVAENASKVSEGEALLNADNDFTVFEFAYGENYFTYSQAKAETRYAYHYELLDPETVSGVEVSSYYDEYEWMWVDSYSKSYAPELKHMAGIDYSAVVSYGVEAFGIEALLSELYETALADETSNLEEVYGDYCYNCGTYHSYGYTFSAMVGYYYFDVEATFKVDAASNTVSYACVKLAGYNDWDLTQDPETGAYSVNEGVEPSFEKELTVNQYAGEKVAVNPYPYAEVGYTSFDVLDSSSAVVTDSTVIEGTVSQYVFFTIGNTAPETAIPGLNQFEVAITDSEGNEYYNGFSSIYDGELSVVINDEGTYTVTVTCGTIVKSFKVKTSYAELTDFEVSIVSEYGYPTYETSTEVYLGSQVQFTAMVNEGANANVSVALKEENPDVYIDSWDGVYTLIADATGTYVVVLTSEADPTKQAEITIVVKDAPSVAEILSGTYTAYGTVYGDIELVFTPESEGALKGTVAYSVGGNEDYGTTGETGTMTYEWLPAFNDMNVTTTGDYYTIGIDTTEYKLILKNNGYPLSIDLVQGGSGSGDAPVEGGVEGLYTSTFTHPMNGMQLPMRLTLNADGTGSYDFQNSYYYGTFSWELVEGVVVFTNVTPLLGTNQITLSATYTDGVITCTMCEEGYNEITLDYTK